MPIQGVTQQPSAVSIKSTDYVPANKADAAEAASATAVEMVKDVVKKDEFVKSDGQQGVNTYTNTGTLSTDQIQSLMDQQVESYKNMISNMFQNQAKNFGSGNMNFSIGFSFSMEISTVDGVSSDSAQEDPWGVNAVASRIMDMAVSLSGGDTSKIAVLKQAVEDGFAAAGKAFGGDLPDISNQTHDEIMNRFEYWEKNGSLDNYVMSQQETVQE